MRRSVRFLGVPILAIAVLGLLSLHDAAAEEMSATRKLGRGVASIGLSVLELPGSIYRENQENGPLRALTVGLFVGIGRVAARLVVGSFEMVTAPFPLPRGYEPVLTPEFTWQHFQDSGTKPREGTRVPDPDEIDHH